jgi:hypothetical protein
LQAKAAAAELTECLGNNSFTTAIYKPVIELYKKELPRRSRQRRVL